MPGMLLSPHDTTSSGLPRSATFLSSVIGDSRRQTRATLLVVSVSRWRLCTSLLLSYHLWCKKFLLTDVRRVFDYCSHIVVEIAAIRVALVCVSVPLIQAQEVNEVPFTQSRSMLESELRCKKGVIGPGAARRHDVQIYVQLRSGVVDHATVVHCRVTDAAQLERQGRWLFTCLKLTAVRADWRLYQCG